MVQIQLKKPGNQPLKLNISEQIFTYLTVKQRKSEIIKNTPSIYCMVKFLATIEDDHILAKELNLMKGLFKIKKI